MLGKLPILLVSHLRGQTHKAHEIGTAESRCAGAPIGYLPKRELIGNQDIRTVILDDERAELVQLAFDLYATGEWTLHRLAEHLEAQGFRSRPTPSRMVGHCAPTRSTNCCTTPTTSEWSSTADDASPTDATPGWSTRTPSTECRHYAPRVPWLVTGRTSASTTCEARSTAPNAAAGCSTDATVATAVNLSTSAASTGPAARTADLQHAPLSRRGDRASDQDHYRAVHLTKQVREGIWRDVRRDSDERTAIIQKDIERQRRKIEKLTDVSRAALLRGERLKRGSGLRVTTTRSREAAGPTIARRSGTTSRGHRVGSGRRTRQDPYTPRALPRQHPAGAPPSQSGVFKRILVGEDSEVLEPPSRRSMPPPFLGARVHTSTYGGRNLSARKPCVDGGAGC